MPCKASWSNDRTRSVQLHPGRRRGAGSRKARTALRRSTAERPRPDLRRGRRPRPGGRVSCAGVEPGDRVLVLVGKTPDWHAVMLGALKAGAVAIPCSEMLRAKDLDFRVRHSGAGCSSRTRAARAEVEAMDGAARGRLRRRGRRSASPTRDRGHRGRRPRVHPLHVRHDEGSEGRRAHAPLHLGEARRRPSAGSTRSRTTSSGARPAPGWAKSIWNVLLGPWSCGSAVDPPRGRLRPGGALPADRRAGHDRPLPGADRVPADGEARRARAVRPLAACGTWSRPASRSTPR